MVGKSVDVFGESGQLFPRPIPAAEYGADGLFAVIKNLQNDKFVFKHVAFNDKSDRFATVDQRGNVYLFAAKSNRFALVKRMGVSGTCIAFAQNQRQRGMLLVGGMDGTIRVYHTETHDLLSTLKGHRSAVHSIHFHSDGRLVLTASRDAAILWDTAGTSSSAINRAATTISTDMSTPTELKRLLASSSAPPPPPNGAARAATNQTSRPADAVTRVAGAAGDVGWIKKRTLTAGQAFMSEARFTPGGDSLLTCFTDDSIVRWNLDSLRINAKFSLPNAVVPATAPGSSAAGNGSANAGVAAGADASPLPFRASHHQPTEHERAAALKESDGKVLPPAASSSRLRTFAVSADGKYLLAAGRSSRIYLWDVVTRVFLRDIRVGESGVSVVKVEFLPASSVAAVLCTDGVIRFVDVLSTRLVLQISCARKKGIIDSYAVSPNGNKLAAIGSDGALLLYDLQHAFTIKAEATQKHSPAAAPPSPDANASATTTVASNSGPAGPALPSNEYNEPAADENVDPARGGSHYDLKHGTNAQRAPGASGSNTGGSGGLLRVPKYRPPSHYRKEQEKEQEMKQKQRERQKRASPKYGVSEKQKFRASDGGGDDAASVVTATSAGAATNRSGAAASESESRTAGMAEVSTPLYQIAKQSPNASLLNNKRLKALLTTYGQFPEKYRLLIWRFLMQLPENRQAYAELYVKGVHPAFADLHKQYPIPDRRLFGKLERTVSALAFWCKMLADVPYLPALVFPFVRLFEHDDVVAFEAVVCIILNWCPKWFEFFPHPPISVLTTIDNLLKYHDPALHTHLLTVAGVPPQQYAWPFLQSLFSEVLTRSEWVHLFDHVISNEPVWLMYFLVAYLMYFRATILGVENAADFEYFVHNQNPLLMNKVITRAYELQRATNAQHQPIAIPTAPSGGAASSSTGGVIDHSIGGGGVNAISSLRTQAAAASSSFKPLPSGRYPLFTSYPKSVVDFHLKERERIRLEELDIERKRELLTRLQEKNEQLLSHQSNWKQQQSVLMAAENERRTKMAAADEARLTERRRIEQEAAVRRLRQINLTEEACRQYMEDQTNVHRMELQRLDDAIARRAAMDDVEVKARLEEEAILNLEFAMNQRVLELQSEKEKNDAASVIQKQLEARAKRLEVQDAIIKKRRAEEDKELAEHMAAQRRAKQEVLKFNAQLRTAAEIEHKSALEELQADMRFTDVERERRIRKARAEWADAQQAAIADEQKRQGILDREEKRSQDSLLQEYRQWRARTDTDRAALYEKEKANHAAAERKRADRMASLEQQQRLRAFDDHLRALHSEEQRAALEEERVVQERLLRIEADREKDRKLELDLLFAEQKKKERAAFVRVMQEAEKKIVAEERARYHRIRTEFGARMTEAEKAMIRRHEEVMAKLIAERERQLWALNEQWRSGVATQQIAQLEADYKEQQSKVERMRAQFKAEEESMRTRMEAQRKAQDAAAGVGGAAIPVDVLTGAAAAAAVSAVSGSGSGSGSGDAKSHRDNKHSAGSGAQQSRSAWSNAGAGSDDGDGEESEHTRSTSDSLRSPQPATDAAAAALPTPYPQQPSQPRSASQSGKRSVSARSASRTSTSDSSDTDTSSASPAPVVTSTITISSPAGAAAAGAVAAPASARRGVSASRTPAAGTSHSTSTRSSAASSKYTSSPSPSTTSSAAPSPATTLAISDSTDSGAAGAGAGGAAMPVQYQHVHTHTHVYSPTHGSQQ